MAKIKAKKIIIRQGVEEMIDADKQVYEINLKTGMILLAPLTFKEKRGEISVFTIEEKGLHLYMPAISKEACKIKFNAILNSLKAEKKNDQRNNRSTGATNAGKAPDFNNN